jgi:uncharacterized membrane protein
LTIRNWAGLALAAALAGAVGCGSGRTDDDTIEIVGALTSQDVLGFETVDTWHAASGTAASTTMRTQGAAAFALTAPVNFTNIVSTPIDATAANLVGLSNAGSVLAVDFLQPTQQPNPFFLGSLQLLVNVPSRSVFNQFLAQIELTPLPVGTFQTLRFAIPDSLRNALRGATFNDLTFTLALNAPSGATGTYIFDNLRVLGATAADFTLAANPASVSVTRGASASATIAIARTGGFASAVAFTAAGLPAGVTATFAPASTTGNSSTVTFTAAATATLGPATVTITGTGGGLARTTTLALTVNAAPNFTLAASPASVTVVRGASAASTVAITRTAGFANAVAFTATGLPAGVTATFNPGSTTGNSTVVTFTAAATAALGPAPVTVSGTGGGLTRSTTIALTVNAAPDFSLAASPASVTVVQGASATSTVTITRTGGFASAVAFMATGLPVGVSATFNPASTTGNSTVVTFTAAATATLGPATVTVTGTGGGLTRTAPIALTVNAAPDFALAADPASVTVQPGTSATSTVTVTRLNGFTSDVAFSAAGLPGDVTATFVPATTSGNSTVVTFTAAATAAVGTATITITGSGGGLTRTTPNALTVASPPGDFTLSTVPAGLTLDQGGSATVAVTINRADDFPSSVVLAATGLPSGVTAAFTPPATSGTDSTLTLTASATAAPGPAVITVTGIGGGLTRTVNFNILVTVPPVQDFALTASPTGLGVLQGDTASSTVSIIPVNGFAGAVTFMASGLPSGVTATFSPPTTTGPDTLMTLTVASTATVGPATVTVIGTSGALVRTVDIALFVNAAIPQDFALTANPSGLGLVQGDVGTTTISIVPSNGFADVVTFSVSGLPDGVTASFSPAATAGPDTLLTLTVASTATVGPATVTVTGTSGALVRTVDIAVFINPAS